MQPTSSFLRRRLVALAVAGCLAVPAAQAQVDPSAQAWAALKGGAVVLFRHARAPGVGDPPGFKIDDCSTQRNLDADGQAQALRIGRAFEREGVAVGAVWSSAWCRTKETARARVSRPAACRAGVQFVFQRSPGLEPNQTATARELLLNWRGPGALVVVTHQVNITALTGVDPASGEGVVLRPDGSRLVEVGRVKP